LNTFDFLQNLGNYPTNPDSFFVRNPSGLAPTVKEIGKLKRLRAHLFPLATLCGREKAW
jgi:hypothetical protein